MKNVINIMPRLLNHHEKQREYYLRQLEDTENTLVRLGNVALEAAGQLSFNFSEEGAAA